MRNGITPAASRNGPIRAVRSVRPAHGDRPRSSGPRQRCVRSTSSPAASSCEKSIRLPGLRQVAKEDRASAAPKPASEALRSSMEQGSHTKRRTTCTIPTRPPVGAGTHGRCGSPRRLENGYPTVFAERMATRYTTAPNPTITKLPMVKAGLNTSRLRQKAKAQTMYNAGIHG